MGNKHVKHHQQTFSSSGGSPISTATDSSDTSGKHLSLKRRLKPSMQPNYANTGQRPINKSTSHYNLSSDQVARTVIQSMDKSPLSGLKQQKQLPASGKNKPVDPNRQYKSNQQSLTNAIRTMETTHASRNGSANHINSKLYKPNSILMNTNGWFCFNSEKFMLYFYTQYDTI
jgi:hypothetical protein